MKTDKCLSQDREKRQRSIQVRCVETGLTFRSIREAAERTGGTYSEIWKAVTGKQEAAYGYHWERIERDG